VESADIKQKNRMFIERFFRLSVIFLAAFVLLVFIVGVGRLVIYKIHPYERGLHLRGGWFMGVDEPGWHAQIPFWDTVIIVKVNERLGYIDQIRAVTSDDLTMDVSLQYTYRVTDPRRFALDVDDPERILFEFVQGKLRDVVNTRKMTDIMHSRAQLNQEIKSELQEKESQYGVQFITVQMQSASPPEDVVKAIEARMVAVQLKEQAEAEAAQKRIVADADYYAAQRAADAEAYQITQIAGAKSKSTEMLLKALDGHGTLSEKYLDYLTAQELRDNSKWVFGASGTPLIDLRDEEKSGPTLISPSDEEKSGE
jgi:regulator of protease activity HflC (stomatin/prohibitin superfamily)